MKNKFWRILPIWFGITFLICLNNVYAIEIKEKDVSPIYQEWLDLPEEERENTIPPPKYSINIEQSNTDKLKNLGNLRLRGSNSDFDLRDVISIKLKNQMNTNECWAFAMTTALETNVALNWKKNIEFSPRHMDYSTTRTFSDGTNPLGHNRELGLFSIFTGTGGNVIFANSYITSGRGPVLEEDMPFVNSENRVSLYEIQGKEPQIKVNRTIEFPNIYKEKVNGQIKYTDVYGKEYTESEIETFRNSVKEHIVKYGGVLATTCIENKIYFSNYTNEDEYSWITSKAYNCDGSDKADHQIIIIGWDDNYPTSNFNAEHRPSKPGAYIVQNSYGKEIEDESGVTTKVFDEGYLYISYEDFLIEQAMYGIMDIEEINYDNIYQHNPLGYSEALTLPKQSIYMANIFKKYSQTEYLTEISVEAFKGDKFDVYVNSKDGDLTQEKLKKVKSIDKIESNGYYTIKLDEPIELTGTEFVVCLKNEVEADQSCAFKVEAKRDLIYPDAFATATSNENESFISLDMVEWEDLKLVDKKEFSNANLTIKAFTKNVINDEQITINSNEYIINNAQNNVRVSPNTKVETIKSKITTNANMRVKDSEGIMMNNTSFLKTGSRLSLSNLKNYTIIVTGDVNGDGKITPTDISNLKKHLVGIKKLSDIYEDAGDTDNNSTITLTDLSKIKKHVVGILSL